MYKILIYLLYSVVRNGKYFKYLVVDICVQYVLEVVKNGF